MCGEAQGRRNMQGLLRCECVEKHRAGRVPPRGRAEKKRRGGAICAGWRRYVCGEAQGGVRAGHTPRELCGGILIHRAGEVRDTGGTRCLPPCLLPRAARRPSATRCKMRAGTSDTGVHSRRGRGLPADRERSGVGAADTLLHNKYMLYTYGGTKERRFRLRRARRSVRSSRRV